MSLIHTKSNSAITGFRKKSIFGGFVKCGHFRKIAVRGGLAAHTFNHAGVDEPLSKSRLGAVGLLSRQYYGLRQHG